MSTDKLSSENDTSNGILGDVMPRYSIDVTIWGDAGMCEIINHEEKTKLELEAFQPVGSALHRARILAEMLNIKVTINNKPDDGRYADCCIKTHIVSYNGA